MKSIPLGAIEKWLLFEQMADPGFFTNWLVTLDQPLDQHLVEQALEELRRLAPVHFSRISVGDDGLQIAAEFDADRSIKEFVVRHGEWEDGAQGYLRHLMDQPLDPFTDGMIRCHLVMAPEPMLALQSSHVAGDGFTNNWLRSTFVDLYSDLHAGGPGLEREPPKLDCYNLLLSDIRPKIPEVKVSYELETPPRKLQRPRMRASVGHDDAVAVKCEIRTFRAVLDRPAFRSYFSRAQALGVSTLAHMAACMALAVDRCYDNWEEEPGDFFAVNIPRDFRFVPEWRGRLGNVVYPIGVPVLREVLGPLDQTSRMIAEILRVGMNNWLLYRLFSHEVRAAKKAPIDVAHTISTGPCLEREGATLSLNPLPVLGVTEVPPMEGTGSIGPSRMTEVYVQSPIIGRRSMAGGTMLSGNVHWHPIFDRRIREFLQTFLNYLVKGTPENPAEVEWELI